MKHFSEKGLPPHMVGKPTRFPERIWYSIDDGINCSRVAMAKYYHTNANAIKENPHGFDFSKEYPPKRHTIRKDKGNRWKVGMDIHFYINSRRPNMFQFAPVIKVTAIQHIKIIHSGEKWRMPWVSIDGIMQTAPEIETLARNDGFDTTKDFFSYFNTDFTGKIIHWTPLKY